MDPTRTLTRDAVLTVRPEATDDASTALGPGSRFRMADGSSTAIETMR